MSPFTGLIKIKVVLTNLNFTQDLPFQYFKKKKFLGISMLLSEIATFWTKKEKFSVNFPENASKQ